MINRLPEGAISQLMLNRLSQITGLGHEHLEQMRRRGAKSGKANGQPENTPKTRSPKKPRGPRALDSVALKATQLMLHKPELATRIQNVDVLNRASDPDVVLLVAVVRALHEQPGTHVAVLLQQWSDQEELEELKRLVFKDLLEVDHEKEFDGILSRLLSEERKSRFESLKKLVYDQRANTEEQKEYLELLSELKRGPLSHA